MNKIYSMATPVFKGSGFYRTDKQLVEADEWVLTANSRCDVQNCGAQAYVMVTGISGELLFCGHHYENIVDNAVGYDKIMKFAFKIDDERKKLIGNKHKEVTNV